MIACWIRVSDHRYLFNSGNSSIFILQEKIYCSVLNERKWWVTILVMRKWPLPRWSLLHKKAIVLESAHANHALPFAKSSSSVFGAPVGAQGRAILGNDSNLQRLGWPLTDLIETYLHLPPLTSATASYLCSRKAAVNIFFFCIELENTNYPIFCALKQLGVLLNYATKMKKEANMDVKLFTSCALFVCNFWDQIPAENVDEVKKNQMEKLTKKLGDLDQQSQVIYLSCQRAQFAQTYGIITEDFDHLLSGINNLVVSSMQNSLKMYSR